MQWIGGKKRLASCESHGGARTAGNFKILAKPIASNVLKLPVHASYCDEGKASSGRGSSLARAADAVMSTEGLMSVFLTSLPEEEEEEDEEEGEEKRIRRRKKGDPNVDTYWRNWGSQYHAPGAIRGTDCTKQMEKISDHNVN